MTDTIKPLTDDEESELRQARSGIDWLQTFATIDQERRASNYMYAIIGKLLTRSPIDSRGACAYCNLYAGQIEVRGVMQWVPRHSSDCVIPVANSLFKGANNG